MEDCCAICAEPLTHVAYGPCGHKDACVECVARLRFVLDDRRCVICQVSCERVFATRHMGEYTETIGADGFEALPKKARAGQLHHDEKLDMFFDDDAVCGKVKALRSLVCGECVRDAGGDAGVVTQHSSVKALKAHMREKHGKFFCEVCLEGRKVFLSEQVLYTRAQLDKHRYGASADVDNAFGQSGFKGHPSCKYCRKFFYDEGQLYTHMQQAHETCHMCRRVNPDKHVYYRDYEELERHFRKDHHACLHPDCLAKKFVVFTSPQELKNHEGLEHGRAMTKAERQAALRIDVGFTVGIGEDGRGQGGGHQGGNVGGGRGGGSPADVERMRAQARAHAQEQLRRAQMNSVESAQLEHVLRASAQTETELPRVASVEDFPDLASQGSTRGGLIAGGWAGRAGSGRSSPGIPRGGSAGRDLQDTEAFPSLGGANQPQRQPRHLQPRGGNPAGSSKVPAAVPTRAAEVLAARLRGLSSSDTSFAAASRQASIGGGAMASATIRAPSLAATHDNFPSLGGGSARAPAPAAGGFGAPPGFAQDGETVAQPKPPPAKQVTIGGGFKQVGKKAKGQWSMGGGSHASAPAPAPAPNQPPSKKAQVKAQADERAVEAAAADVAARSDALVTRVRQILDANAKPGATFNAFAALSSQFKNGQCAAPSYVAKLKVMGLDLAIIDELAALMPDGDKRTALEKASAAAARLGGGGGMGGGGSRGGVDSVDAAAAILFGGSKRDENDWDCPACTFHNGGSNVRCDVCDGLRPGAAVGPVVGAPAGVGGGGSAGGGGGGGKRGGKVKKGKTVSLTAVGGSGVGGIDDLVDPGRSSRSAWGA